MNQNIFFTLLISAISLIGSNPVIGQSTAAVGTIDGTFGVAGNGTATYAFPVDVPPSRKGLQPEVNVNYSSTAGASVLGYGWSLAVTKSIQRCGSTIAQDGKVRPVQFDSGDHYCFGGSRLVAINGDYGGNNTEYRTEKDTFIKFVSYGNVNGGPEYFVAYTKGGFRMEFGRTSDSRLDNRLSPNRTFIWKLNQEYDTHNNVVNYTYSESSSNAPMESVLERITYAPSQEVEFVYDDRPDTSIGYIAGADFQASKRLKKIVTHSNGDLVLAYKFNYNQAPYTNRSRLGSVEKCTGDESVCMPATQFDWQNTIEPEFENLQSQDHQFTDKVIYKFSPVDNNSPFLRYWSLSQFTSWADVNGDGRDDWVRGGSDLQVRLSNGDGTFQPVIRSDHSDPYTNQPFTWENGKHWYGGVWRDINADGNADWTRISNHEGSFKSYVKLSNGDGTFGDFIITDVGGNQTNEGSRFMADVNGDKRADIVNSNKSNITVQLSTGAGNFGSPVSSNHPNIATHNTSGIVECSGLHVLDDYGQDIFCDREHRWIDANGDGAQDWALVGMNSIWVRLSNGDGTFSSLISTSFSHTYSDPDDKDVTRFSDMNGDGLSDLVAINSRSEPGVGIVNSVRIFYAKGDGRFSNPVSSSMVESIATPSMSVIYEYPWSLVDFSGDGIPDFARALEDNNEKVFSIAIFKLDGTFDDPIQDVIPSLDPFEEGLNWADINGDGLVDWVSSGYFDGEPSGRLYTRLNTGIKSDLVNHITNGLGAETSVTYIPLLEGAYYENTTFSSLCGYPRICQKGSIYVVGEYETSDGTDIGGMNRYSFLYRTALFDAEGNGWIGFRRINRTNHTENTSTETSFKSYYYDSAKKRYPYKGMWSYTKSYTGGILTSYDYVYRWGLKELNGDLTYFPYVEQKRTRKYTLGGNNSQYYYSSTIDDYDDYGNLLTSTENKGSAYYTDTVNVYYPADTSNWFVNRVGRTTVTKRLSGQADVVNTTDFVYNPTKNLVTDIIVEPNDPEHYRWTHNVYDDYGNLEKVTVTGSVKTYAENIDNSTDYNPTSSAVNTARISSIAYDPTGSFPISQTNAEGHATTTSYDTKWGMPEYEITPNGASTWYYYDGFGRPFSKVLYDANGSQVDTSVTLYGSLSVVEPFISFTYSYSGSQEITTSDILGRTRRSGKLGMHGEWVFTQNKYDALGRLERLEGPSFASIWGPNLPTDAPYTRYAHDGLGRETDKYQWNNDESVNEEYHTHTSYDGFKTTVTNPLDQETYQRKNAIGKVVDVKDSDGNWSYYYHDPAGNVRKIKDSAGNDIVMTYDRFGRKLTMQDPDMGNWEYEYDVFGNMIWQKDGNDKIMTATFDKLDRITSRSQETQYATWSYDSQPYGLGQVSSTTTLDNGYPSAKSFTYSTLGKLSSSTSSIAGENYTVQFEYDQFGRLFQKQYPQAGSGAFRIQYNFNSYGYTTEVINPDTNEVFWNAISSDALGHATEIERGSNTLTSLQFNPYTGMLKTVQSGANNSVQDLEFQFDEIGNLTDRWNYNIGQYGSGVYEHFSYDDLNRVTQVAMTGYASTQYTTYSYDQLGNILTKSDAGATTYEYTSGRPHSVSSANGISYYYDGNGNMTSGGNRDLAWTSFNKPSHLYLHNEQQTAFINYDASYQRIRKQVGTKSTIYVDSLYEKVTDGNTVTHTFYVDQLAIVEREFVNGSQQEDEIRLLYQDHQGSIVAMTDYQGNSLEQMSFDAYGERRDSTWQDVADPYDLTLSFGVTRGYTGHEHDDEFGLINMNGRLYDPTLGRMISADPTIPALYNMQALNRYSYVYNNPLSYTDPSGYTPITYGSAQVDGVGLPVSMENQAQYRAILEHTVSSGGPTSADSSASYLASTALSSYFSSDEFANYDAKKTRWEGVASVGSNASFEVGTKKAGVTYSFSLDPKTGKTKLGASTSIGSITGFSADVTMKNGEVQEAAVGVSVLTIGVGVKQNDNETSLEVSGGDAVGAAVGTLAFSPEPVTKLLSGTFLFAYYGIGPAIIDTLKSGGVDLPSEIGGAVHRFTHGTPQFNPVKMRSGARGSRRVK